jgi:hypothetical protein
MIEYYEVGDLVIIKTEDLLRAGIVSKTLKNYTIYKVRFIGGVTTKNCTFSELMDYDKGRELLEKQIESRA